MRLRTISPDDFERALQQMELAPHNRTYARAVLVTGERATDVARRAGVSRQQVQQAANRVLERYLESIDCPPDWDIITITFPPDMRDEIQGLIRKVKQRRLGQDARRSSA